VCGRRIYTLSNVGSAGRWSNRSDFPISKKNKQLNYNQYLFFFVFYRLFRLKKFLNK
jgi:hypothetical protein